MNTKTNCELKANEVTIDVANEIEISRNEKCI